MKPKVIKNNKANIFISTLYSIFIAWLGYVLFDCRDVITLKKPYFYLLYAGVYILLIVWIVFVFIKNCGCRIVYDDKHMEFYSGKNKLKYSIEYSSMVGMEYRTYDLILKSLRIFKLSPSIVFPHKFVVTLKDEKVIKMRAVGLPVDFYPLFLTIKESNDKFRYYRSNSYDWSPIEIEDVDFIKVNNETLKEKEKDLKVERDNIASFLEKKGLRKPIYIKFETEYICLIILKNHHDEKEYIKYGVSNVSKLVADYLNANTCYAFNPEEIEIILINAKEYCK